MTVVPLADASDGPLRFTFDGREYPARDGETVAAALLRAGVRTLTAPGSGAAARGAFCWMGWCQECRVLHRGRWIEACRLSVQDGLEVQSRRGTDAR